MSEEPTENGEEEVREAPETIQLDELTRLREEIKEAQEKYLRVLADSENTRKRMQKEKHELTKYGIENALVDFLHPIDCFEKALSFAEAMSDEVRNWAVGFEMILSQFKQILASHGIEEYHSIGKEFDPHLHEAIEMIETTDYPPNTVVEEDVRGYKVGDKPVRVAKVRVAKAPKKSQEEENNEE